MKSKFFVPFGTAQLLKKKGYPQDKSDYGYFDNGDSHPLIMFPADNFDCAAPTYHEVLDWLEEKGINIGSGKTYGKWYCSIDNNFDDLTTELYSTREEALNSAIISSLEML